MNDIADLFIALEKSSKEVLLPLLYKIDPHSGIDYSADNGASLSTNLSLKLTEQGMLTLLFSGSNYGDVKKAREEDWQRLDPKISELPKDKKDIIEQLFGLGNICETSFSLYNEGELGVHMFEAFFGSSIREAYNLKAKSKVDKFDSMDFSKCFSISATSFFPGTLIWLRPEHIEFSHNGFYKIEKGELILPAGKKKSDLKGSFAPSIQKYLVPIAEKLQKPVSEIFILHCKGSIDFKISCDDIKIGSQESKMPMKDLTDMLTNLETDLRNTYVDACNATWLTK